MRNSPTKWVAGCIDVVGSNLSSLTKTSRVIPLQPFNQELLYVSSTWSSLPTLLFWTWPRSLSSFCCCEAVADTPVCPSIHFSPFISFNRSFSRTHVCPKWCLSRALGVGISLSSRQWDGSGILQRQFLGMFLRELLAGGPCSFSAVLPATQMLPSWTMGTTSTRELEGSQTPEDSGVEFLPVPDLDCTCERNNLFYYLI